VPGDATTGNVGTVVLGPQSNEPSSTGFATRPPLLFQPLLSLQPRTNLFMKYAVKTAIKIVDAVADSDIACDHRPMAVGVDAPADRCEVVTDFHRLEQLSSDWKRLWGSDPRAEIFQTPEWARAWWFGFGQNFNLCSLVVFAGDRVVGILPLVERDHFIRFLGTPEADYADIICEEYRAAEVLRVALRTLLESVAGWKECAFHHLSRHSRLVRYYGELPREIRSRLRCVPAGPLQTIVLRNQREEVFKSLLGKHHTRRLQNKLRKAGRLQFRHLAPSQEAEQHLSDFFRHHVRRHAAVGRKSTCADPDFCRFIRAIIQELGPSGRVRFGVLELNGQPMAWDLGFEVNGKFLLYQHTFDLDAWHYTPGEVLLWNALEYARDHVSREFDFGRGDELYKDRFANYSRETFSLFVESPGLMGRIRGAGRTLEASLLPRVWKIKQIAKKHRPLLRAYRALRMWMIGTWGCARQAKKNGALLQYGVRLTKELFGNSVWSKRSTDVFAFATSQAADRPPVCAQRDGGLDVSVAQFGDLVDLSWQHPEILSLNELQQCRKRMKNGDRVYIAREKSQIVSVCWVSSPEDAVEGTASRLGINPSIPAMVIDEFWSVRDRDITAAYRLLLSVLTCDAAGRRSDLLVHCSSDQPLLRRELERRGFLPKFQTIHYKVLSRFRRDSVSQYPKTPISSSQLA
jgi:CelD/BcsL family acetyltransferase involved in cellulose biosynthesis